VVKVARKYVKFDAIDPPHEACSLIAKGRHDEAITNLERRRTDISDEVRVLYDAVLRLKPEVCIECGTRQGESSVAIMAALDQTGGRLESIDLHPVTVPKWLKRNESWKFTHGDATLFGKAWRGKVKFIFVDTSHWFRETLEELETFLPLLEVGGEAYFHDTRTPWEVSAAIHYFNPPSKGYSLEEVGGELAGMAKITRER